MPRTEDEEREGSKSKMDAQSGEEWYTGCGCSALSEGKSGRGPGKETFLCFLPCILS